MFVTSLIALIAGVALPLAYAPFGFGPVAFASIAALFWCVREANPKHAAWLGALYGFGSFGFGVHWIYYSLHLFGAAIAPLAALLTLLFVLVLCLFPMATCWLYARLVRPSGGALIHVFLFAGLWLGSELIRDSLFGGFPWLALGYSQIATVFSGYAPVIGVYGIGWVIVVFACSMVVIVAVRQRFTRVVCAALVALLAITANVLYPKQWTTPTENTFNVRLVQGNIKQELKFSRERLASSLRKYVELTRQSPVATDVVIWPETAIPTYWHRIEESLRPFTQEMMAREIEVLSGVFYKDDQDRSYNSFVQLGGAQAVYSKRHLVPFGEFMPFRFLLEPIAQFIQIPMSDLTASAQPIKPMQIKGEQLGLSICYEDVFGDEMRDWLPASTVLVNVSNDAWFGDSIAPHQHQEIAQMRAREFARPLIRVTNTGISSSINYRGQLEGTIAHAVEGALDVAVQPRTGSTPYTRWGDLPLTGLALVTVLLGWAASRRRAAA